MRALLRRLLPHRVLPSWLLFWKGERSELFRGRGWARSLKRRDSVDERGEPIPWIPYAAVGLLEERLTPAMSVLELGAGQSTLFFERRAGRVVTIEHDRTWLAWVRQRAGASATILAAESGTADAYVASLAAATGEFDLILVDGPHRNEALAAALGRLSPRGVILLDDSHRPDYAPALEAARAAGFRHLHFEGHKAASVNLYRTTVFYRDGNCLGI